MKNFFSAGACLLMLTLSFSACKKQIDAEINCDSSSPRHELTVSVGGSAAQIDTKVTTAAATLSANEAKVSSLQILVFNGDFLDAYASATSSTASVTCTQGTRTVYAVVNAPDLSGVSTPSALKATLIDLSSNAADSFTMIGSKSVPIPATSTVSIDVERMVSRVVLKKVTCDFDAPSLAGMSFKLDKVYLVNAAGNSKLDFSAAPTKWYNADENKGDLSALLLDSPAATIADGASYSTVHYFYTMPNPASSKKTMLVLEATLGTQKYYYPIELPALVHNTSYEISSVKILRPGSDDPATPVSTEAASFSVSVKGWTTSSIDEQII